MHVPGDGSSRSGPECLVPVGKPPSCISLQAALKCNCVLGEAHYVES